MPSRELLESRHYDQENAQSGERIRFLEQGAVAASFFCEGTGRAWTLPACNPHFAVTGHWSQNRIPVAGERWSRGKFGDFFGDTAARTTDPNVKRPA